MSRWVSSRTLNLIPAGHSTPCSASSVAARCRQNVQQHLNSKRTLVTSSAPFLRSAPSTSSLPLIRSFSSSIPTKVWAKPRTLDRREQFPPTSDAEVVQFFRQLLPSLEFPLDVATRMVTHTSFKGGHNGRNSRLSFIGRRVMQSYFYLFLHSRTASGLPVYHLDTDQPLDLPQYDQEELYEKLFSTHALGNHVGSAWELEKVMRWTPAVSSDGTGSKFSTGLYKVRGTTVEAVMGGIFHQFGGTVAHHVFHTRLLPALASAGTLPIPRDLRVAIDDTAEQFGGKHAPIPVSQSSQRIGDI